VAVTRIPHPDAVKLCERAWAIVNRIAPDADVSPHGFYQREAMIEVARYRDQRNRLYRRIFWRLAEKAGFETGLTEVEHLGPGRIAA
jgi:hypothetical protein